MKFLYIKIVNKTHLLKNDNIYDQRIEFLLKAIKQEDPFDHKKSEGIRQQNERRSNILKKITNNKEYGPEYKALLIDAIIDSYIDKYSKFSKEFKIDSSTKKNIYNLVDKLINENIEEIKKELEKNDTIFVGTGYEKDNIFTEIATCFGYKPPRPFYQDQRVASASIDLKKALNLDDQDKKAVKNLHLTFV